MWTAHRSPVSSPPSSTLTEHPNRIQLPRYWDWTLDVPQSKFLNSPLFHPIFGFGGNGPYLPTPSTTDPDYEIPGRSGGGCVVNGPFKNMVVRMGPGDDMSGNPRCLHRDMSPYFARRYLGTNVTTLTLAQPDYGWFFRTLDGDTHPDRSSIHGGGHYAVGGNLGEMGDLFNSPSGMYMAPLMASSSLTNVLYRV